MSMIILDTDAGLDDAAAILLGQSVGLRPDYYICTKGNTSADGVLRNVFILNKYLGLGARIIKGCEESPTPPGDFFGEDGLGNLSRQMMRQLRISGEDVKADLSYEEFKRELLLQDHITYIAIGPLITLADLIQEEEIRDRIEKVYVMGGGIRVFNSPDQSEFNFHENPESVKRVLSSGLNLTLIPLDITIHQRIDEQQIRELESTGKYPAYIDMFRFIKKQSLNHNRIDAAVLHDTIPVLYCRYPERFKTEDVRITCDSRGHLDLTEDDGYNIHLVTEADTSLLYDCLKQAFAPAD